MNPDPISKEELGWLAVRAAGIVFGWLALSRIAGVFYAVYLLTNKNWQDIQESLGGRLSWELAWPKAAQFVLFAGIAVYLLRGGRFIHRILTSCPLHSPKSLSPSSEAAEPEPTESEARPPTALS